MDVNNQNNAVITPLPKKEISVAVATLEKYYLGITPKVKRYFPKIFSSIGRN
jgi:hypothetical protein